jgi:hypothetical protein
VLANLSAEKAKQLGVWQPNHHSISKFYVHKPDGCPVGYLASYLLTWNKKTKSWAEYIWLFYKTKHEQESKLFGCNCDALLKASNP